MAAIAADHELLFGLLALQNGLIDQVQLVAAFQAWTRDRNRPLADHLVAPFLVVTSPLRTNRRTIV